MDLKKRYRFQSWNNELMTYTSEFPIKFCCGNAKTLSIRPETTFHYWISPSEPSSIFAILKMKLDFQKINWEFWSFGHKAHLFSPFFIQIVLQIVAIDSIIVGKWALCHRYLSENVGFNLSTFYKQRSQRAIPLWLLCDFSVT